jgi:Holliday junction resolvase RusA-like endonuclease
VTKKIHKTLLLETGIVTTPTPKGRPRFTSRGRSYTPAATVRAEHEMANALLQKTREKGGEWPKTGPLAVSVVFAMPVPESWSKKKQQQARSNELWHTSRPDADNLLKLVLDAANGVLWVDDAQLVMVGAGKEYAVKHTGVMLELFSVSLVDDDDEDDSR